MDTWAFSFSEFLRLAFLSIACGSISFTIAKSKFFEGLRNFTRAKVPFIGEGLSCPYCMSHWVAFILTFIFHPTPVVTGIDGAFGPYYLWDYFVSAMAMVALASITCRVIYSCYIVMMAPQPPLDKTAQ